jgi:hypothetical protein
MMHECEILLSEFGSLTTPAVSCRFQRNNIVTKGAQAVRRRLHTGSTPFWRIHASTIRH